MSIGYKGQLGVLIGLQAAVIAVVAALVYLPSVAGIEAVNRNMDDLARRQTELCQLAEANPNPQEDIRRARSEIQKLESAMPPESRVSWLSARIADLLRDHRVDLRAAADWQEGGEKPASPELKRLQKLITVRCAAQNLEAFLESVSTLPFLVIVEDIQVSRDQKWGSVTAEIKLATFVLRTRPATAAAPPQAADLPAPRNEPK